MNLYMILIGCKPKGRFTEQHDIFFGIGASLEALVPQMIAFWPEAKGAIHIDAWREVTAVDGYRITVIPKDSAEANKQQLFFLNLGGYRPDEFEEYHFKILAVAESLTEATKNAKSHVFYKDYGFKGATSHIDDKYGIDIDDAFRVKDILAENIKEQYQLAITKSEVPPGEDPVHPGYIALNKLLKN